MNQETISNTATANVEPLNPTLQDYRQQFAAIEQDARVVLDGLNDAQFNWRAGAGRWSVAECFAHLNVTGQMYLPDIDRQIKKARAAKLFGEGRFRHTLLGGLLVRAIGPPPKLRFKAPKIFTPLPEHLLAVVVPAFASLHEQFSRRIREANGLNLRRIKVASPASSFIKLTLGECFALLAAHERRHLWQARQVRDDPNFPRN